MSERPTVNGVELGTARVFSLSAFGRMAYRVAIACRGTAQDALLGRSVKGLVWRPVSTWMRSMEDAECIAKDEHLRA
jgi:hypothetical protein